MARIYRNSPFGIALYPWVNKPDTKFNDDGLFKVNLALDGKEAEEERARIDAQVDLDFEELTKDLTAGDRKKWTKYYPYEVEEDDQGNPTGRIIFQYRQNAKIKLKDGTIKEVKIGLYDAADKEMHKPIFGGSELRARYSPRPIKIVSTKKAGTRLDFSMVQVKKLATTGGGGFGSTVDGYVEEDEPEAATGFGSSEGSTAPAGDY